MRVVISLTTLPSRLEDNKILPALHSIWNQTRIPDVVYLGLPKIAKRNNLPYPKPSNEILELCTVINLDEDYGPVSKILGGLFSEHNSKTIIITIDDDNEYPKVFIEELLEKEKLKPNSALGSSGVIIGNFPWYFSYIRNEEFRRYEGWTGPKLTEKGQEVDILCGYSGVLYKRGFFPKTKQEIIDQFLQIPLENKNVFLNDDIYISCYLNAQNIPRHLYVLSDINEKLRSDDALSGGVKFYIKFVKAVRYCHKKNMIKNRVKLTMSNSMTGKVIIIIIIIVVLIITLLFFLKHKKK